MTPGQDPLEHAGPEAEVNPGNAADIKIVGYCRACGKALDASGAREMNGTIYCEEHALRGGPAGDAASPWTVRGTMPGTVPGAASGYRASGSQPPPLPQTGEGRGGAPVLAFLLGWIPGVGAIFNGQYAKGFIHVVIFGLLVSIVSSDATGGLEPLFGLLIAGFIFYMAFEAYHTAKKRQQGQPVDEWSGMFARRHDSKFPAGPLVLIALGVVFLMNNLGLWDIHRMMRYWPALLIALGVYMLWNRLAEGKHERQ